jgi:isoleucyl-tRNA synthetase
MYQGLVVSQRDGDTGPLSVHHEDYPEADEGRIDTDLERQMKAVRQAVSLGRGLRVAENLKVRQPLGGLTVVSHDDAMRTAIDEHADLVAEELNVKVVLTSEDEASLAHLSVKPNFRALGPRFGSEMKAAAKAIQAFDDATVALLLDGGTVDVMDQEIGLSDVVVEREPREGVAVAAGDGLSVAIDTELTEDLIVEGIAREVVKAVQALRRDLGLDVSDRITLAWSSEDDRVTTAMTTHGTWVAAETLATRIATGDGDEVEIAEGVLMRLRVSPAD